MKIMAAPTPRTPDPMSAPPLRWGVMGPGWIAERFVHALQQHTRQQVVAVGSRDAGRAQAFAHRLGLERAHGSYPALAEDPQVDVVYVATPHPAHHACARTALLAGKHALVEKPLALNAAQAGDLAALAGTAGVFCMEGMWTLLLPKFDAVRQLIADGALGTPQTVLADHGEHFGPEHRIMRADLAGGPLLDLGSYPVALAVEYLGDVETVYATGRSAPSGVNGQTAMVLSHTGGGQAVLHTTILGNTPTGAVITGTEGTLTIPGPFFMPGPFALATHDGIRHWEYTESRTGHGALYFEAAHVAACIGEGRTESPLRPLAAAVNGMAVLDAVRQQIGTVYDADAEPVG
jgi:predicted dehydrogenase